MFTVTGMGECECLRGSLAMGYKLCNQLDSIRDAVPIILHHHERWDGSGCPDAVCAARTTPWWRAYFSMPTSKTFSDTCASTVLPSPSMRS